MMQRSLIVAGAITLLLAVSDDLLAAESDPCAQSDRLARNNLRWAEVSGTITHDDPAAGGTWTAEVRANASYTVVEGPGRGGAPSIVLGGGSHGAWRAPGGDEHPCAIVIEGELGPFRSIFGNAEYRIQVAYAGSTGRDSGSASVADRPPGSLVLEGESCGDRLQASIERAGRKTAWELVIRPVPPPPFGGFCDALLWTGAGDPVLLFMRLAPALRDEGVMEAYREEFPDLSTRSAALGISYQQILWNCGTLKAAWLVDETGSGAASYEDLMAKWPAATRVWTAHKLEFEAALATALDAIAADARSETARREIIDMAEAVRARGMESLFGMNAGPSP